MQERNPTFGISSVGRRQERPPSPENGRGLTARESAKVARPRGRSWKSWLILVVVSVATYWAWQHAENIKTVLALRSSLASSNSAPDSTDARPTIPIHATTVTRGDFPITLYGLGTAQAWNSVTVRSRVDGQVEKIAFEEGKPVKAGDVLVELDARPFQAALDQATAKIAQDQANLASAEADLARTRTLVAPGYATKQLFDQQTAAVNQLKALIKADEAAQDNAKVNLSYTTIRAPISGRLGLRTIDIGNIVHATDQNGIVTIAEIQPIAVVFTAPEDELPAITRGLKGGALHVIAYSSDGKTELGRGTLAIINNDIDIASGTIRLKGRFENPENLLWPGLSVTTQLLVATLRNQTIVPDIAVQRGPMGLFAYVVRSDHTVEKRDLKVGQIGNGSAVIDNGVEPGEQVVTAGYARL
ncbi:MAG: efflux RND transporter periplasmic adaptor subunit, partial [Thermomicrobiales bacterium]